MPVEFLEETAAPEGVEFLEEEASPDMGTPTSAPISGSLSGSTPPPLVPAGFDQLSPVERSRETAAAEVEALEAERRLAATEPDPFNPSFYRAREEAQDTAARAKAIETEYQALTPIGQDKAAAAEAARQQEQTRAEFAASGQGPNAFSAGVSWLTGKVANMAAGALETFSPSAPALADVARDVGIEGRQMQEYSMVNRGAMADIARGGADVAVLMGGNPAGFLKTIASIGAKGANEAYGATLAATGNRGEAAAAGQKAYMNMLLYAGAGAAAAKGANALIPATTTGLRRMIAGGAAATGANVATSAGLAAIQGEDYGLQQLAADVIMGGAQGVMEARSRAFQPQPGESNAQQISETGAPDGSVRSRSQLQEVPAQEGGAGVQPSRQGEGLVESAPEVSPSKVESIVPAIRVGDEVIRGNKGETHKDVLDRFTAENPDRAVDAILDFDSKRNPNFFVDESGAELSRQQLQDQFGVTDSQGLRELQAAEAQRRLGPGAANIEEPFTNAEPVGAWNAKVDEQRASRGLPPLASEARRADEATWDAAEQRMTENPDYARSLVDTINEGKKESVSDTEQAALLREMVSLREARDQATARAFDEQTYSETERATFLEEAKAAEERLQRTEEADRKSGTAQGRALRIRRLMSYEDFTLGGLMGKARRAKGEDLTPEETAALKTKADRFQKAKDAFESRVEEGENLPVSESIRRIEAEASKDPRFTPEVRSLADRIIVRLEEAAKGASQRIRGLMSQLGSAPDPSVVLKLTKDLAIMAAADIGRLGLKTTLKFTRWASKMVKEFGEKIEPYLRKAWDEADAATDTEAARAVGGKALEPPSEAQKALDVALVERERLDQLLAGEIAPAKKLPREALTQLEEDVRAEIAAMRGLAADVRREQNAKPKEDPATVQAQRALDAAVLRREQLAQMLEGEASPAKRTPRESLSELENDVRAEITAMESLLAETRRAGKPKDDPEAIRAQRALDRAVAEKELIEGILAGEITPAKSKPREALSQLEEDLRLETAALKKLLAEQNARPKADPNTVRENAQVKALERAAAEYERRLNDADFTGTRKRQGPDTARVSQARALRDAAKTALDAARRLANPPKTKEEIALQRYKAFAARKTAEIQDRIDRGDFAPRAKKAPLDLSKDPQAIKAKAEMDRVRNEFQKQQFEWEQAQRTRTRKFLDGVKETLATSRSLITSADVSAPFRQGGFLLLGDMVFNPRRAARQVATMFRQLASERGFEEAQAQLSLRDNAKSGLYERAGLYLADMSGKLSGREESMRSNLAEKLRIPWLGKATEKVPVLNLLTNPGKVVRASNRAYAGFLNRQRADSFDAMVESMGGPSKVTPEQAKAIATFVNTATGRGTAGHMERAADVMARYFFSPRFLASRFQLAVGEHALSGQAKREVAKQYAKFAVGLSAIYGLALLNGGTVERDPRSADFGKAKFGDTRVDPLSGLAQVTTFMARMATGQTKQGSTVKKKNRAETFTRFARTKLAPIPGVAADFAAEKTLDMKEPTVADSALRLTIPLSYQTAGGTYEEQGPIRGTIFNILNLLGMGVNTYEKR